VRYLSVLIASWRQARQAGHISNNIRDFFRWAGMGLIFLSSSPLDVLFYVAVQVVALFAVSPVIFTLVHTIVPKAPHGHVTLLVIVLLLGSMQVLCLSVIGARQGNIFAQINDLNKHAGHVVQGIQTDDGRAYSDNARAVATHRR
jgi:hypothetical protein